MGGIGRPQRLINEDVRTCDFFVLVLHDRWGTPPDGEGRYTSGSEEEFSLAEELARQGFMLQILVLFKGVPINQFSDPGPQLTKVLEFRKKLERERGHLYKSFDDLDSFRHVLRQHLAAWLRWDEEGPEGRFSPLPPALPPDSTAEHAGSEDEGKGVQDPAVQVLIAEAEGLANQGNRTEAEALFTRAIVRSQEPQALLRYGEFLIDDGRLSQAAEITGRAGELARLKGAADAESAALNSLARIFSVRGDLDAAEEKLRAAIALDERHGWRRGMAAAYGNLGVVLQKKGDLVSSEAMHRRALELNSELGRTGGIARQTANLGNLQFKLGDIDGAEQSYQRALLAFQELDRSDDVAACYLSRGLVLEARGELASAEEMYLKALQIFEKLGLINDIVNSYGNLGNVRESQGDWAGAEEFFSRALEIARRVGMKLLEKKALKALDRVRARPREPDDRGRSGEGV